MKPLSYSFLFALVLLASPSHGDDTVTMQGRINWNESEPSEVLIGMFDSPIKSGAEALSWTSVYTSEFNLKVPDRDEVQLVVLCQDFIPQLKTIYPRSPDKQFELELEKGITVEGTVVSTDKLPVANAVLTMEREDLPKVQIPRVYSFRWTSDAEGRFKIGGLAPHNDYEVHVGLPYAYRENESFAVEVEENDIHNLDLRLFDAYFVQGRVVDANRASVQNPTIKFSAKLLDNPTLSLTTTGDSNGEFRLGPFEQAIDLKLVAVHQELGSTPEVETTPGVHDVELVLVAMVHLVGTVIDHATGKSIDDFTLTTMVSDDSRTYSYSDANGEISSLVDRETIGLIVDSAGHFAYFAWDVDVESVDEYDLGVIELHRGRQLKGRVYDASSGQAIVGAEVSLREEDGDITDTDSFWNSLRSQYLLHSVRSRTGRMGEYELEPIPAHSTRMGVSAQGYIWEEVIVEEGVVTLDIGLVKELQNSGRIKGVVLSNTGISVVGTVFFEGGRNTDSETLGNVGTFDAELSAGEYEVYALTDKGRSETVQVSLKQNEVRELTLVVDSKGRLTGVIEGLMNGETVNLSVFAETEQIQVGGLHEVGNGAFAIEGIGFGTFRLTARTNRNRAKIQSFELTEGKGEENVALNFTGQSRLYVSLRYPDGTTVKGSVTALAKKQGHTSGWADIRDDGTVEIERLEDGEYTIIVNKTNRATMKISVGREMSMSYPTPIEEVDVIVRGDTELNIQLTHPSDSE